MDSVRNMSSNPPPPAESTVDLKNRWLAAGLALLLPGLGHLYQQRNFKAGVYFFCILGLFFTGQALGEWKVVYLGDNETAGRFGGAGNTRLVGRLLQGYGAQFPVGVFAWPAMIQSSRYHSESNDDSRNVDAPFTTSFEGEIGVVTLNGPLPVALITGTVTLEPSGRRTTGTLSGTTEDGRQIEAEIARVERLGQRVSSNEWRSLAAELVTLPDGIELPGDQALDSDAIIFLNARIPRPFVDRYQVPLGGNGEDALTAKLGGRLEIAYVFTWIAGLLNVLAIWDALDGPAYGYGNEPENKRKSRRRRKAEDKDSSGPRQTKPASQPA